MIDDIFLSVNVPDANDGIVVMETWQLNNSRRPELILAGTLSYKSQVALAEEGHPRYLFRLEGGGLHDVSGSAPGSSAASRKRPQRVSSPASAKTAKKTTGGERRGVGDLDEEDNGLKMSHRRYTSSRPTRSCRVSMKASTRSS